MKESAPYAQSTLQGLDRAAVIPFNKAVEGLDDTQISITTQNLASRSERRMKRPFHFGTSQRSKTSFGPNSDFQRLSDRYLPTAARYGSHVEGMVLSSSSSSRLGNQSGRSGWLCKTKFARSGVLSPFLLLQDEQAVTTFVHSWRPPFDSGTTWSIVRRLSESFCKQYWQV